MSRATPLRGLDTSFRVHVENVENELLPACSVLKVCWLRLDAACDECGANAAEPKYAENIIRYMYGISSEETTLSCEMAIFSEKTFQGKTPP